MSGGSQQLRAFRRAIRSGATVEAATEASGIPLAEARLHHADMIENPPAPEDFEPIAPTTKEDPMARTARKPKDDDSGEIKPKDFAQAKRLYLNDIKPAGSRQGEAMKDASDGYKAIKKGCNIQSTAARAAFRLVELEDAKRDDWLRGFVGLLAEFNIDVEPVDLVDKMEGKDKPRKPRLVTVPSDDSDLLGEPDAGTGAAAIAAMNAANGGSDPKDGSDGDEFTEATDEELAAQEGRGGTVEADA